MPRRTRGFGPSLEQFDKKTLLSAGGIAHLAGGPHQAVENAELKFKFYFALKNSTNENLTMSWKVETNGHRDSGQIRVDKGQTGYVASNAIESGGVASISATYKSKTVPVSSSISRGALDPPPRREEFPVTTLS
jgi:hypothetical protein